MVFVYKISPPYNSIYFNTISRIWMNEELNWTGREKISVYLFNSPRYIAANLKTWRNTMDKRIHVNTQLDF